MHESRHDKSLRLRRLAADGSRDLKAVHIGYVQVENHRIKGLFLYGVHSLFSRLQPTYQVTSAFEDLPEQSHIVAVVIHDEDLLCDLAHELLHLSGGSPICIRRASAVSRRIFSLSGVIELGILCGGRSRRKWD
jgi:hypothetical protein